MGLTASVLQLLSGATGAAGSIAEAQAIRAQARAADIGLRAQQRITERQAEDALRRGQLRESQLRQRTKRLTGAQRASLAAQGIDPNLGSAFELQSETLALGALDAATIRTNAAREALGFQLQAQAIGTRRAFGRQAARQRSRQTLVTGGLAFARSAARAQ